MSKHRALKEGLSLVFQGIERLKNEFPSRKFTIDGRLVGDIGEVIAALEYDIELDAVSQAQHDGTTSDGKRVQVKATFRDSLTFSKTPDYYLGFKLHRDGSYTEIYNGPGHLIFDKYKHRAGVGVTLLSFPNKDLSAMSSTIHVDQKIKKRQGMVAAGQVLPSVD
jgi:hypothetical protein